MDAKPKTGRGESWVAGQIVLLLGILLCPSWPDGLGSVVSLLIGLSVGVVGLVIVLLSASSLGSALSVFPRPLDDGRLTQTGLYALVRHPIYCGVILSALGWAIFRASVPALILTLILAIFFDRKAAREEIWLTQKYPEYGSYRQRVHKLIPFIY